MKRDVILTHEFVEYIPDDLTDGIIYVSIPFATAVHKCCCGCGCEVVTPLSPTDWKLIFDGMSISLEPSIGNWSFRCESHYFIRHNRAVWAPRWSQDQLDAGRAHDRFLKENYCDALGNGSEREGRDNAKRSKAKIGFWQKVIAWISE